jgi:hypothetical protein
MSEFIVHSIPGSPFGRAVLAALEEKGASYRLSPVAPGTFQSPEHLARHPFGRVPVLEHDGFSLYESQAILRYLDRVLPTPALTPADPKRAARMDQVMNINDWYLFHGVGNVIVFHRVVGPRVMGSSPTKRRSKPRCPRRGLYSENWRGFWVSNPISLAKPCRSRTFWSRRQSTFSLRRRNGRCWVRVTPTSSPGWRGCRPGQA